MHSQYSTTQFSPAPLLKPLPQKDAVKTVMNTVPRRTGGARAATDDPLLWIQPNAAKYTAGARQARPAPLAPVPVLSTSPSSSYSGLSSTLSSMPSSPSLPSTRSSRSKRFQNDDPIMQWVDRQHSVARIARPRSSSALAPATTAFPFIDSLPVAKPTHAAAPAYIPNITESRHATSQREQPQTEDTIANILEAIPELGAPHKATVEEKTHTKAQIYDTSQWPCVLPNTPEEQDRMVTQHYILRALFDGDFAAPVQQILEAGCIILDVGCGPGTWTMEMGTEFPKSTFIGVDHASHFPRDIKPKNCHFRNLNVLELPLPFPDNSFDYIFQRDLNWGLQASTWPPLVKEYYRILKPGGWLELVEQDFETQSSSKKEAEMNDKMLSGLTQRQQDPYIARHMPAMLVVDGFRRIESRFHSLPLGWASFDSETRAGPGHDTTNPNFPTIAAMQHLSMLQSLQPWMSLVAKMSPEKYTAYTTSLLNEWKKAETYVNWHCVTCQRPKNHHG